MLGSPHTYQICQLLWGSHCKCLDFVCKDGWLKGCCTHGEQFSLKNWFTLRCIWNRANCWASRFLTYSAGKSRRWSGYHWYNRYSLVDRCCLGELCECSWRIPSSVLWVNSPWKTIIPDLHGPSSIFKVQEISCMLGVGKRTIERRMAVYGLSVTGK